MTASVSTGELVAQLLHVLREAFEGPPGPWSYFTDKDSRAGVFGTLDGVSASEASQRVGSLASTIASHVQHLTGSLVISTRWIRGEMTARDRDQSWTVTVVDEAAWAALRKQLRREYDTILMTIQSHGRWDEDAIGGAVGAIAHVAYHLGAIRQRLAVVRALGAP
jgi:hypothetical protein